MCLEKLSNRRKASRPINCYKVMYLSPDGMRVNSISYPKGNGYSVGDVMLPSVRLSNLDFINRRRVDRLKDLNGEVVHSFSMTDNKYYFARCGLKGFPVFVMCEIPKGETYWLGYGGEYGSLSLKIKEIQTIVWKVDVKYKGLWLDESDESLIASKSMITIDELKRHLEMPECYIKSCRICSYNVLTGESEVVFSSD